ncbi:transglycosylase domain-containing protein [Nitriliruptor alkaliphilus]|uniref:transglycosylase domain-containing protein n=1 Tax=Nitriliruptor alkaliphilus TaxID=427918 RepID=UPI000699233B|nr:transglycosylase domain-containing protein [Nitriliruptor alkaliphilus]
MAARSAKTAKGAKGATSAAQRPWWKRWWVALLVFPAIALGAVGLLLFFVVFSSVPLPEDIAAIASTVYDAEGEEVGGLSAEANQEIVDFTEIPEHTRQAVMAAEDRGFYDHGGISATGIARALFTNVRGGGVQQGGSTITQQYIKNVALTPEQTYTRKVQEAALAIKLERAYEKDEILGFYMNSIYWGRGAIGIQSAAQVFFGTTVDELDVNQSALLAGIIAAPEAWDPGENPERADQRRRFALGGMLEQGWLDQATHDELVDAGMPDVIDRAAIDLGPNAYYLDAVRRVLTARPEFQGGELYRGLRVHTELDPRMQEAAQEELTRAIAEGPTDSGAIVTVDPRTGGVRALVGGPDARQQSLNTALVSPRQPGSTFKAFSLQAFTEAGNSPETRFPAPATIEIEGDPEGRSIRNFGDSSFGEQTVYQATASSTNTVYYQMQEEAGRERVIEAAARAGLPTEKREEIYPTDAALRPDGQTMGTNATLTLGVNEFTPLEMASAFGTYAAEGLRVTPHLVSRVEDADGNVVWQQRIEEDQEVDLNVARVVTAGLRGVITSGSGRAADIGRPAAGKTGTTQASRDAWFVGYVPQLSTSVWLGNLDNSEIEGDATGGGLAAPLWGAYMARAVEGLEVEDFVAPDLSGLEGGQPEEAASCPDGYRFAEPPTEADEDGFFPDVLTDIRDDEGRPCVEEAPEPEPECPDGFAFADPPSADADPMPQVLSDITDEDGRPCVETDPEPEPEPEPTETEEPEPAPLPTPTPTDPTDDGTADDGTDDDGTDDDDADDDDGTDDDGTAAPDDGEATDG